MPNPRTFFDLTVGDKPLGRVVVSCSLRITADGSLNSSPMCKFAILARPAIRPLLLQFADVQCPENSREVSYTYVA